MDSSKDVDRSGTFMRDSLRRPWKARRVFRAIARHKVLAILLTGTVAFATAAGLTAVRTPVPRVHDEFSYLLSADTFGEGRLANPVHPCWQHFESFHIIQQPSYASKYQPGQGAMLALGTLLTGRPLVGAWLSTTLAAAAICWMLRGWMPSRWALLGGMLIASHGLIHLYWSLTYWGGSLPLAGGALMFGAMPRIIKRTYARDALVLALGAIALAATRPFEGLIVGLCVSGALLIWMFGRNRPAAKVAFTQVVLPAVSLLAVGIGLLAYYNAQVTGACFTMPYQVHEETYGYGPLFLWQSPGESPDYHHQAMRDFHTGWAIQDYHDQQTFSGWLKTKTRDTWHLARFFFGDVLFLPLLMLPLLLRQRRFRFVWIALAVFLGAELMVPWMYSHYLAPIVPLLFLLVVEGMRRLQALTRQGHAWARFAVPAIVLLHIAALAMHFVGYARAQPQGWQWQRARLAGELENTAGEHLVIVRYAPEHRTFAEWVYNRANIDGAKVVWAREMGSPEDQSLLEYFEDRQIWLLEADAEEPKLVPYWQSPAANQQEVGQVTGRTRPNSGS